MKNDKRVNQIPVHPGLSFDEHCEAFKKNPHQYEPDPAYPSKRLKCIKCGFGFLKGTSFLPPLCKGPEPSLNSTPKAE